MDSRVGTNRAEYFAGDAIESFSFNALFSVRAQERARYLGLRVYLSANLVRVVAVGKYCTFFVTFAYPRAEFAIRRETCSRSLVGSENYARKQETTRPRAF